MKYTHGENIFDKFFNEREALIEQFKKGDISKKEYIEEGYFTIKEMDIKPFKIIDNFDKAIFNYQYYNTMAKFFYLKANEIKKYGKHIEKSKELLQKVDEYYYKKDRATLKAVEIKEFYGVEVYYIQVKSEYLKRKLYEVIFDDHPGVILHSTSEWLLKRFKEENIFDEKLKKSLISNYVNQKY
ncbi:DUF6648 family protein [Alkaliphilus peptidifermentans]|uniref:Uncharacterized protein n=1 Tax=Alkaliphilus peptidifermentans DSM 18978 TaxID=1120976 RepID=A0A1G5EJ17_9FIRM|nr:DUF6648 family protein [Alkaliphilus peptidifermentans]SCY26954.1 hypothetical protein SAMN03080606_01175 [Alkaliphilus peptidifermentans DSM 18978]